VLCRTLEVSASGYYAAQHRRVSARAEQDVTILRRLQVLHAESRRTYGRPRLRWALRQHGLRVGDRRVRRLMRAGDLVARGRRRYRVTTDSTHDGPIARNHLARAFAVSRPNRVWAADITALWTTEGWLYLAVLLDLASRRVIGWAAHDNMETDLPVAALRQALAHRRVRRGLLHHSDRGVQYASARYQALLQQHGLRVSMSRKGNCWDNSVVESFFRTLKTELHPTTWLTRAHARSAIGDYIERFYNERRLHSTLGYRSPAHFEAQLNVAI
jgi:putative transposase